MLQTCHTGACFSSDGISHGSPSPSFSSMLSVSSDSCNKGVEYPAYPNSADSDFFLVWIPGLPDLRCLCHLTPEHRRHQFTQVSSAGNGNLDVIARLPHLLLGFSDSLRTSSSLSLQYENKGETTALDVHLGVMGTQPAKQEKK